MSTRKKSEVSYNPFAVASILVVNTIIFGPVSGGHFNPAITLGVLIKEIRNKESILFEVFFAFAVILSQIFGGFLGVFLSFLSISDKKDFKDIRITFLCSMLTDPEYTTEIESYSLCNFDEDVSVNKRSEIFLVELVCSILLVCVVLNLKYNEFYSVDKDGLMNAMAIGTIYFGMIIMSISTSGACLNPAIGLVQSIYQKFVIEKYNFDFEVSLKTMWIYIVAPLIGGVLASLL